MHPFAYTRPDVARRGRGPARRARAGCPRPRRRHGPHHPPPRRLGRSPGSSWTSSASRSWRPGSAWTAAAWSIGATTVMTDMAADPLVRRHVRRAGRGGRRRWLGADPQPGDAGRQHVQRVARRRHGPGAARATARSWWPRGPGGLRRIPLDELFVRSGVTTLLPRRAGHGRSSCRCRPIAIAQRPPAADPPPGARPGVGDAGLRRGRARA